MKPPEEIKKGLEVCGVLDGDCENCPYDDGLQRLCVDRLRKDALAYIKQIENAVEFYSNTNQMLDAKIAKLESRLAQVERERDAAVEDFTQFVNYGEHECKLCRHNEEVCFNCHWEWIGVKSNENRRNQASNK